MTRDDLASLGWTDETLSKAFRAAFGGDFSSFSSRDPDTEDLQQIRENRFREVCANAMAISPPVRTEGPTVGPFAVDAPDVHFGKDLDRPPPTG